MYRIIVPLLLLSILPFQGEAQMEQRNITITGTIVDAEGGFPLEYATFVLQRADDPNEITGGITDLDGKFEVESKAGTYNIRAEYISYTTYSLNGQTYDSSIDLGTIRMSQDVAQLSEVEVVGERTTVEVRLDKKIYNIG